MNLSYSWSLDEAAYLPLVRLPKRKRLILENTFREIAARPSQPPAFTARAIDGAELGVCFASHHMIVYRIDHAIRMVCILEITEVE